MKNEMMVFEHELFGELRIIDNEGTPWFVAMDVAKALGYNNPAEAIRDHCKKANKISHHSKPLPPVNMLIIPESDMYRLVMRSKLPAVEKFQDWVVEEVLPSIRKTGSYSIKTPLSRKDEFELGVSALEASSRLLRMSDISKLSCLKHLCISMGVSTEGLPKYLPRKSHILSATELLKRRGKPMSIHAFNGLMLAMDLLEIRERPSTNGQEVRKFKALTEAGMYYGENSVNPDYPLETQPHYYEDKFDLLLDFLNETVSDNILD